MKTNKLKFIPKNTLYCYSSSGEGFDNNTLELKGYKPCPYFAYRKTNFGIRKKGVKKEMCEYCKHLHKYLTVQDQVKDCGISLGEENNEEKETK